MSQDTVSPDVVNTDMIQPTRKDGEAARQGRLYRMIWRWHFYAGLFCIPFVIALAVTGSVYLFRPQIEAWIDRDLLRLERTGAPATADAIVAAATASIPGSKLAAIVLPEHADEAARVLVSDHGMRTRVYVHPDTLDILKSVPEDSRFNRVVFKLHGELLLGSYGSVLVELAASWAIVMVLSGLYLWWPRQARGLGGVLYPRLGGGARRFWRDVHAVTGIWLSGFTLVLLVTGLPWALVWGGAFEQVRAWTGTAAIAQDWSTSSAGEHAEHMHTDAAVQTPAMQGAPIDLIVARAAALNLAPPVLLTPPAGEAEVWWAKSNAANRPLRDDVALSATTGEVVAREDFAERHIIDQVIGFGIAAHEGQLFGVANLILSLVTAAGLVLLCVSAFVMWRKRAPEGVLGAPPAIPDGRIGWGLAILILTAAILLPVLGVCLAAVALVERLVLSRWSAARVWLGLAPTQ